MSRQQVLPVRTVICEFEAIEKGKKLDRRTLSVVKMQTAASWKSISEQEIDFPWVPVPNNDEFDADTVPFQPRFLLQELIFAPAVSLWESTMQSGLAFSERDCRLRMCYSADPRDCQLSKMQQQRAGQLRGPLLGAPDPAGTRGSRRTPMELLRKPARQFSVGPKEQRTRRADAVLSCRVSCCKNLSLPSARTGRLPARRTLPHTQWRTTIN